MTLVNGSVALLAKQSLLQNQVDANVLIVCGCGKPTSHQQRATTRMQKMSLECAGVSGVQLHPPSMAPNNSKHVAVISMRVI